MTDEEYGYRISDINSTAYQVLKMLVKCELGTDYDVFMGSASRTWRKRRGKQGVILALDSLQRARLILIEEGQIIVRREVREFLNSKVRKGVDTVD